MRRDARWLTAALSLACLMAIPAVRPLLSDRMGVLRTYDAGTIVLLIFASLLVFSWPRSSTQESLPGGAAIRLFAGAAAAFGCCYWTAGRLLPDVFAGALDVNRGDMLVLVENGVSQLLAGRMPYRMYHLPWDAPLSYGPALWMPYIIPVFARADLRTLTLAAYLFVMAWAVIIAARTIARGWIVPAICVAGLAAMFAWQPDIARFYQTAHTPVYWPLLVIFCWLLIADRWLLAAVALGLLVCARTTMIALVPIFLASAYHRGHLSWRLIACFGVAAIAPFVPFFVRDPGAVQYGMFGVYLHTIKGFVWQQRTGVTNTFGVTGVLLRYGLERFVEVANAIAVAAVYALSWRPLSRGGRPEPWMALALLVFSMTTLWPVLYIYFDVWVLVIAGLAAACGARLVTMKDLARGVAICAAVSVAAILAAGWTRPGTAYAIDVGSRAAVPMTGGGFRDDEPVREGDREFVWVSDGIARIRLPRAGWTPADIQVHIRPFEPMAGLRQTVMASLNGHPIGSVALSSGWQAIEFHAPARDWKYGFNVLTLYFTYAVPDESTGRSLSAGIDRVVLF